MTPRFQILKSVRKAIVDKGIDKAKVLVGREPEDEPVDGGTIITLRPGEEEPWGDPPDRRAQRALAVSVSVGYQPAAGADDLDAWETLEDRAQEVIDAVFDVPDDQLDLPDGFKHIELGEIGASEQPAGGASIGVEIIFDVKYVQ